MIGQLIEKLDDRKGELLENRQRKNRGNII